MADSGRLGLPLLAGFAASVMLALGLLMMKSRGEDLPPAEGSRILRALAKWIGDPVWLGGLGVQTVGYALYVGALAYAPVSLLAVTMQGGIAMFVVLAVLLLHERAQTREWIGIGGIVAAMVLLGFSLEAGASEGAANIYALAGLSAAGIGGAVAAWAPQRIRHSGLAEAIASGIAFGLGSLYTKALAETLITHRGAAIAAAAIVSPWLYLTAAANLGGLVLLQNSFHRARGIIAMPLSSACSNIVPIIGGMVAFGEVLPANRWAASMRVAAFVLTIAAGAMLAAVPEPLPQRLE